MPYILTRERSRCQAPRMDRLFERFASIRTFVRYTDTRIEVDDGRVVRIGRALVPLEVGGRRRPWQPQHAHSRGGPSGRRARPEGEGVPARAPHLPGDADQGR